MQENIKLLITQMTNEEAREFFLEPSSYMTLNFPVYYCFDYLLKYGINLLGMDTLDDKGEQLLQEKKYSSLSDINYIFHLNKSKESYRPIIIIHPLLYVDLVNLITKKNNWDYLINRYNQLDNISRKKIICESIPFSLKSKTKRPNYGFHFWEYIEQESIKLSLEFKHILKLDISNFYSSIYTHIIPWAIHDESVAKNHRKDNNLLGNKIDRRYQYMNYGETVSIPQGNIVSDFMAEFLLRYIDSLLVTALEEKNIEYKVLRYRDDYRIFTQNKEDEQIIKKELVTILGRHKLSINESKSKSSSDLIVDSMKEDKVYWIEHDPLIKTKISLKNISKRRNSIIKTESYNASIQKHLIIIKLFSDKFPNSGQLINAILEFENRIKKLKYDDFTKLGTDIITLIAIVFNIIDNNPKIIEVGVKLLSRLFSKIGNDNDKVNLLYNFYFNENVEASKLFEQKLRIINIILNKVSTKSTNHYLEIWLQRLVVTAISERSCYIEEYVRQSNDKMVSLANAIIRGDSSYTKLFNEVWIKEEYQIKWDEFINITKINSLKSIISESELKIMDYNFIQGY